jgi:hypothetical protein
VQNKGWHVLWGAASAPNAAQLVQAAATGQPVVQAHLTGPGDPQPSEGGAGSGAAGQQGAQQSVLRLEPLVGGHQFNHQFDGHAVRTDALAEQAPSDLQVRRTHSSPLESVPRRARQLSLTCGVCARGVRVCVCLRVCVGSRAAKATMMMMINF